MDPNDEAGGQGDATRLSRSDLVLLRKAARERWGIPDPVKTDIIEKVHKVLTTSVDERNIIAAAKTFAILDKIDQQDERLEFEKQKAALDHADDQDESKTDPEAAARALKAANDPEPFSDPEHPADNA